MKRGDLVSIALQGDYGKPRPALIIQSDLFGEHLSVSILPISGDLRAAPLFRLRVEPSAKNGLRKASDIMADKIQTVPCDKIGEVFGHLRDEDMLRVNRALALFLGLA